MRMVHDITLQQIHFEFGLIQLSECRVTLFCVCGRVDVCVCMHDDCAQRFISIIFDISGQRCGRKGWDEWEPAAFAPRVCDCKCVRVIGKRQDKYRSAKEHRATVSFYCAITVIPCLLGINTRRQGDR